MNTTETHAVHEPLPEKILSGVAGGSITEGIGAVSAIILAIVGLAGVLVNVTAAVGTIVIGAVILMDGGMVGLASRRLRAQGANERQAMQLGSGVSAEFFGGLAGIVLGILALFRPMPETLLAVAVLVFGATLLLGGRTVMRLHWLLQSPQATAQNAAATAGMAYGGYMFVGLATIVLGILAVIGLVPMTLILVGLLGLGASALFGNGTQS